MKNHEDSWKNRKVFESQLALNERELSQYPFHWGCFFEAVSSLKKEPKSLLDVGCGSAIFSELCKRHLPNTKYRGLDYAQEAIDVASERWDADLQVRDYRELTESDLSYETLHLGALLDVLPNADEALRVVANYGFKNLILGRMKLVEGESKSETYEAYNLITTYAFYHNMEKVHHVLTINGYDYKVIGFPDNATIVASKEGLKID